ncbi:Alpha/Beta hydrolase protein, partial [Thamnocephalis sphaerospora]
LVLAHGYGAGLGYFYRNFEALAQPGWRVYAIDWLGMGRSARVKFPARTAKQTTDEYVDAEDFFVDSLERWRKAQGIDRMMLAGHSMGGYMSTVYSLKYPERVDRLVLISPVGIPEQPSEEERADPDATDAASAISQDRMYDTLPPPRSEFQRNGGPPRKIPGWVRSVWDNNYTPQWFVRASGPFGYRLVRFYVNHRMAHLPEEDRADMHDYTYHISSASGSGEYALSAILAPGAHARRPLRDRLSGLRMPTTFIYGEIDWMDYRHAVRAQPTMQVETEVVRIPLGGHNMFLENPEAFDEAMRAEMRKAEQ